MSNGNHTDIKTFSAPRVSWRVLRWNVHQFTNLSIALLIVGVFLWGSAGLWFAVPVVLFGALLTDGIARPGSSLFYPTVTHGPRSGNKVALTFDDGPDPDVTPKVLDALAEVHARATFFVIGKTLATQPALARRMVEEGHVIGNHSWQHSRLQNFYFANWHMQEIERGLLAIRDATGEPALPLYRPPVGLKSWAVGRAAWHHGLTLVAWSLHSRDTRLPDAEAIAARVLDLVQPGDIVLLHDGHDLPGRHRPFCAQAVRLILKGLRDKGLECVTVPELLGWPGKTAI
jgi:peptidoglycan/xylan/chitin deacetylase (PgdA/CDA1 family)